MAAEGPKVMNVPCLGNGPSIRFKMKAQEWYNQLVYVLSHGTDRAISRKDMILSAATLA